MRKWCGACVARAFRTIFLWQKLFAECLDIDIAVDLDLAGQAEVGIFLQGAAQADLLQGCMRIDIVGGRHDHAVGGAEAIAVTVRQAPQAAIDPHIILQSRVTHMLALRHLYLYIFTDKINRWHGLLSSMSVFFSAFKREEIGQSS